MVQQNDFPATWSDECDSKHVRVEVEVFDDIYEEVYEKQNTSLDNVSINTSTSSFIEIPTTDTEAYLSTNDSGGIQRSASITVPSFWDRYVPVGSDEPIAAPVRPLIVGYGDSTDVTSYCKIYHRNDASSAWELTHFGFVSGIGGTSVQGEISFDVYDFTEYVKTLTANKTFTATTIDTLFEYVIDEIEDIVPLTGNDTYQAIIINENTGEEIEQDASERILRKVFSPNKNTMYDVLQTFHDKTQLTWQFTPEEDGVYLSLSDTNVITETPVSRTPSIQRRVAVIDEDTSLQANEFTNSDVTVIENTALNSIAPYNAIKVNGVGDSFINGVTRTLGIGDIFPTKEYPTAEAYVPRLVASANGRKLYVNQGEQTVVNESTTSGVESAAKSQLVESLRDVTEGEIYLDGEATIRPNDLLTVPETCNGQEFVNTAPVSYRIENVRHHCNVGDGIGMRTTCQVSIAVDETDIRIESDTRGGVGEDIETIKGSNAGGGQ